MDTVMKEKSIGIFGMGVIYLLLSTIQQLLVNKLFLTSFIIMFVSALFTYFLREDKKIRCLPEFVFISNIWGLFFNYYTMLEFLGLIAFVVGLILLGLGLYKNFMKGQKVWTKILSIVLSVVMFGIAGFLNFTAVFPDKTMIMMGNTVQPVVNVWEAEKSESVLESGIRLISNIQYDTVAPNGFLDVYYSAIDTESHPTLIFIHGGGYMWGDKASGDPNADNSNFDVSTGGRFLAEGYNVVQMNYALAVSEEYPFSNCN